MLQRITLSLAASTLFFGLASSAPAQPTTSKPVSKAVTATGIVVGAPSATEFRLRSGAAIYRVKFHSKMQMQNIQGGDSVRVYGRPLGLVITNANVKLLQKRASDNADDYGTPPVETVGPKDVLPTPAP